MSYLRHSLTRRARIAGSFALMLAISIALLEVLLRLVGTVDYLEEHIQSQGQDNEQRNVVYDSAYVLDPYVLMKLRPNLNVKQAGGDTFPERLYFDFSTNEYGFRGSSFPTDSGTTRVLCIGDSCTFGYGVGDGETWPAQLQDLFLAAENTANAGAVEVFNAAIPGYTSFQGLRFLQREGSRYAPCCVVAGFGFNDCQDLFDISIIQISEIILPFWWMDTLSNSHLQQVAFLLRLIYMMPSHLDPAMAKPQLSPEEFQKTLADMADYCKHAHIPLVLLAWPMRCQIMDQYPTRDLESSMCDASQYPAYQQAIFNVGEETGTTVIDLVEAFRNSGRQDLFGDAIHPSVSGDRLVAEVMAEKLPRLLTGEGK